MSHELSHQPFETIRSSDFDRIIQLLRNGVGVGTPEYASGVAQLLTGAVGFTQLTPELTALLSSLAQVIIPIQDSFDVIAASGVTLSAIPLSDSEEVFVNGLFGERGADYTIIGPTLNFSPPVTGRVVARYETAQSVLPLSLGSFSIGYNHIKELGSTISGRLEIYGNASGGFEFSEVLMVNLAPIVPPQVSVPFVDVSSGVPDRGIMARTGGLVWVIGGPSGGGTNVITKIDENDLVSSVVTVTPDTSVTISSIATDGVYLYCFMKGGSFIAPNTITKLDLNGNPFGVMSSGLLSAGKTDLIVSNLGFVYASFSDPLALPPLQKVIKFDPTPSTGILKVFNLPSTPTQLFSINSDVYVINGNNLTKISGVDDSVVVLQTYTFTPSALTFDGTDVWIASGTTLYKCDINGNILHQLTPQSGQNIQTIFPAFGFIWVTYSNDVALNITKVFPGVPGV